MCEKSKSPQRGRPRTVGMTLEDENLKLKAENEDDLILEYIKCVNKIYLSPIKDLHTGMIESCEISKHPSLALAIATIDKISDKAIPESTYLHSDQGSLYNHLQFQKRLEENNFIQSMSRKGTPIDNSPMESFFGTFKSELLYNPLIKILDANTLTDISNCHNFSYILKGRSRLYIAKF